MDKFHQIITVMAVLQLLQLMFKNAFCSISFEQIA